MKSHFNFNKQERSGVFFLVVLLCTLLFGFYRIKYFPFRANSNLITLDSTQQAQFDSLAVLSNSSLNPDKRKFNPNYISEFKGYTLGMSAEELDRLYQFRSQNKFINSIQEFQEITKVSDSLLEAISPFFKFPQWEKSTQKLNANIKSERTNNVPENLNEATANDLRKVPGIGEVLSARIIKFRNGLGGFLTNEQLYDVYGLDSSVAERTLKKFQVIQAPKVEKININTASVEELANLVYIPYHVAENIVSYREENGMFSSLNELFNVSEFPINKIERLELYLSY